jgi:hypothetical protein
MASRSQDNPEKVTEQSIQSVQEQSDAETDRGFAGAQVDPTDRANYTVSGVTSGAPTPETDEGAAEAARKAVQTPR